MLRDVKSILVTLPFNKVLGGKKLTNGIFLLKRIKLNTKYLITSNVSNMDSNTAKGNIYRVPSFHVS